MKNKWFFNDFTNFKPSSWLHFQLNLHILVPTWANFTTWSQLDTNFDQQKCMDSEKETDFAPYFTGDGIEIEQIAAEWGHPYAFWT